MNCLLAGNRARLTTCFAGHILTTIPAAARVVPVQRGCCACVFAKTSIAGAKKGTGSVRSSAFARNRFSLRRQPTCQLFTRHGSVGSSVASAGSARYSDAVGRRPATRLSTTTHAPQRRRQLRPRVPSRKAKREDGALATDSSRQGLLVVAQVFLTRIQQLRAPRSLNVG